MGWFSDDELTNMQLVEYFVSANIWRLLTGACVFLAIYCYGGSESQSQRPVCCKKASLNNQLPSTHVVQKPDTVTTTTTSDEPDDLSQQHQRGVNMVFNGPVHVVMPTNLGKVFDDWDFEHQDCRTDLF